MRTRTLHGRATLVCAIAALLLVAHAPAAVAAYPGFNGRIAFRSGVGLYTMNADGTGVRRVGDDLHVVGKPAWSPDGQLIAVADGTRRVLLVDESGAGSALDGLSWYDPTWSPDGQRLAGSQRFPLPCGLGVVDADGTGLRTIAPGTGQCVEYPAWSPQGDRIAFTRFENGSAAIYTVAPDGSDLVRIRDNGWAAQWSPDGSKLVFSTCPPESIVPVQQVPHPITCQIRVMDADGGNDRVLSRTPQAGSPAWSPDGNQILFVRYTYFAQLWRMLATGTLEAPIVKLGAREATAIDVDQPDWQPVPARRLPLPDVDGR